MRVVPPTATELQTRITEGERATRALTHVLARPGIRLQVPAGTPLYSVEPRDPALVVRQIGAKTTRGTFKNGKFVAVDTDHTSKP